MAHIEKISGMKKEKQWLYRSASRLVTSFRRWDWKRGWEAHSGWQRSEVFSLADINF